MNASNVGSSVESVIHAGLRPSSISRTGPAAWLLSVVLHAIAFSLMLLVVFPLASEPTTDEIPVVNARLIGDADSTLPVGVPDSQPAPPSSGLATTALRFAPTAPAIRPTTEPRDPTGRSSFAPGGLAVIGTGFGGGIGQGPGTGGEGDGAGLGVGLGGGGPEFFGVGGSVQGVRKVVYVVDRSGSMVDTFRFVQAELKRSISALRRSQKFHVIFFNAVEPLENPPGRLVNAIDAHKNEFFRFLETVTPQGGTKPEKALRIALSLEPDVLYLLSDGINFDPTLLQKINDWNSHRKTRIFTIAYLDQTGRQILERLAREHGGEYRFVSEDELP